MKLILNLSSFRFRIILTLVVIITVISFGSFYVYNHYVSDRIYSDAQENLVTSLTLLRDQIIAVHDGRIIKTSLKKLEENKKIMRTFLFDGNNNVIYPEEKKHVSRRLLATDLNALKDDITLVMTGSQPNQYFRSVIRMRNGPQCYSCHSPSKSVLGYIVVDFPMTETNDTVQFARNSSIAFTLVMVLIILGFVFFLHYRFVKRSLSQFRSTINVINNGDLNKRIEIPSSKELGELAMSFNRMVEHFQYTQKELARYHEKEIRNSQKLASIGEMSARLAHEIRNPITGIANAVEILHDELKDNGNRPVLEEIRRQALRVDKAISNLLKFSRSKDLNPQEGDINEIVKSVVFFLESQSTNKNIVFTKELDPSVPVFLFDQEQVENVLLNLGINAAQILKGEGNIIFRTSFDTGRNEIRISIRDDGAGIPPEKIGDIFKPFFSLRTEGTGLGLAIAKEIVDMHGGEIWVENNPDHGCTFYIILPV